MPLSVRYSHAAPFIREKLLVALRQAEDASTQRDRKARFAEAYAYASTLKVLAASADQVHVEGVNNADSYVREYPAVLRFFGGSISDYQTVMGAEAPVPEIAPTGREPRRDKWDMGHRDSHEYRDLRDEYLNGDIDKDEFLRRYRDPENYRVEHPGRNRSGVDEATPRPTAGRR